MPADDGSDRVGEGRAWNGDPKRTVGRRDYLRIGSAAVGAAALLRTGADHVAAAVPTQMADPSPSGSEVGGGQAYYGSSDYDPVTESEADTVIRSSDSNPEGKLKTAMERAGEVIYLRDDVVIDFTGESQLPVSSNVTVASDRGKNGNDGALVYFDMESGSGPLRMVQTHDGGIRFTGLRIEGPRTDYFNPNNPNDHFAQGLYFVVRQSDDEVEPGYNVEVDNCQLYGWTGQAINVGSSLSAGSAHVHHCSFHNNQMSGYGYGVHLANGHSLIDHCFFDLNRHCIAGYGFEENGFEAHHNIVERPVGHAFDMHRLEENGDGVSDPNSDDGQWEWTAGGTIDVHDNQFRFTTDELGYDQEGVAIRGHPYDHCYIDDNQFAHPDQPGPPDVNEPGSAFRQDTEGSDDDWVNLTHSGNEYGVTNWDDDFGSGDPKGGTVGTARETGYITVDNSTGSTWVTEAFNHSFTDPVAFLKPFTYNGPDPVHARLRNVGSDSFDMTLEEWDYDDGAHDNTETGHFLVVEQGVHVSDDDVPYEAGSLTTNHEWASVAFDQNFASTPVVFTQAQTNNGPSSINTRTRNVSTSGFDTRVQEQESLEDSGHTNETVGYFAIEPGIANFGTATVEVGTATVDDSWAQISFDQSHDTTQRFLASVQTYAGWQPVDVRRRNLTNTGVEVFLQEETSADSETGHVTETVGYLVTTTSSSF